jgi:glutathione S-transferase
MKLYGHPWSINTRKVLATIAEKGHEMPMTLVMLPKGEHKRTEHLRVHPFGKVPVIDDDRFVLYEMRAINAYLDAKLSGPLLVPTEARERARMDQWINIADSYFIPFAHPMIVELLFRRHLGGDQNAGVIATGRAGIDSALDALDTRAARGSVRRGRRVFARRPALDALPRVHAADRRRRAHRQAATPARMVAADECPAGVAACRAGRPAAIRSRDDRGSDRDALPVTITCEVVVLLQGAADHAA